MSNEGSKPQTEIEHLRDAAVATGAVAISLYVVAANVVMALAVGTTRLVRWSYQTYRTRKHTTVA